MSKGKVWKYGDDVNTDVIFPGKYTYTITDVKEMAKYAMEDLDSSFAKEVKEGDVIIAGKNFGCGSSREQAAFCLKEAGVACIIAPSFSRIFYRNAINAALPTIVNKEIPEIAQKNDEIELFLEEGKVTLKGKEYNFPPLPESVIGILKDGGLIPYLQKKLKNT